MNIQFFRGQIWDSIGHYGSLNKLEKPGLASLEMEPHGIFGANLFCPLWVPVGSNGSEKPGSASLEMEPRGIFGANLFCPLGAPIGLNGPEKPELATLKMEPHGIFGANLFCPKVVLVNMDGPLVTGKAIFCKLKKMEPHGIFGFASIRYHSGLRMDHGSFAACLDALPAEKPKILVFSGSHPFSTSSMPKCTWGT